MKKILFGIGISALSVAFFFLAYLRIYAVDLQVGPRVVERAEKAELRLFALGDTGKAGAPQTEVALAMEKRCQDLGGIDGILLLGDHAYPAGFSSPDDPMWQQLVAEPYDQPCLRNAPIFPVLGNHDYRVNPAAQILYSQKNPRWQMPARFYQIRFGELLRVIAFDSNWQDVCLDANKCAVNFLHQSLQESHSKWVLITAHHPIVSISPKGFNYRGGVRGMILRPYLCQQADLYISGHSHHLEHQRISGCRLESYVAGGGGGDLDQPDRQFGQPDFAESNHGFLEVIASDRELKTRFWSKSGGLLYETIKH